MIQANELRIGNWVKYLSSGKTIQIESVHEQGFNVYADSCFGGEGFMLEVEDYNAIESIPLTPEILEKAGFVKKGDDYSLYVNLEGKSERFLVDDHYKMNKSKGFWTLRSFQFGWGLSHIDYLHQLQNLYFALTGEELQLNLSC